MNIIVNRRNFIGMGSGALLTTACSGAELAEKLTLTPKQTEGPFYPDNLPLDTDNDLLIINENSVQGIGEITQLTGRVLTQSGSPLNNAKVEIWQVDSNGIYMHSKDPNVKKKDANFQSYGRFLTNSKGEFFFRTIKPVKYNTGIFRTPHIHIKVTRKNKTLITSQLYIKGEPLNQKDRIWNSIKNKKAQDIVTLDYKPFESEGLKQFKAHADIVVGYTPQQ